MVDIFTEIQIRCPVAMVSEYIFIKIMPRKGNQKDLE
jgi:hypothetical protein